MKTRVPNDSYSFRVTPLPTEKQGELEIKDRSFDCELTEETPYFNLVRPRRQLVVELVKFPSGKGPEDYIKFYRELDKQLLGKYGKTRCELDIHEVLTFRTRGPYDMVAIWDAPDINTIRRFVPTLLMPASCDGLKRLPVDDAVTHKAEGLPVTDMPSHKAEALPVDDAVTHKAD